MITIRYERFENLDADKRMSIINAGFMVFGEHGYAKASVEEIIKAAGISKGSLFYYFESKKNFYIYLYEYCGEMLEKAVDCPGPDGIPDYMKHTDFFDRLSEIEKLKIKFSKDYPHVNTFIKRFVFEDSPELQGELSKINNRYAKERAMAFFQGLDYYKFKDGIDPRMIINLLTWCSEGCINQILLENRMPSENNMPSENRAFSDKQKSTADMERVVKLYHDYVDLFRKSFYKDEYLK